MVSQKEKRRRRGHRANLKKETYEKFPDLGKELGLNLNKYKKLIEYLITSVERKLLHDTIILKLPKVSD